MTGARRWRVTVAWAAGVAVAAAAPSTQAYVRYMSLAGDPYSWGTTSVEIAGYSRGVSGLTLDEVSIARD